MPATVVTQTTQGAASSTTHTYTTPAWTFQEGDKLLICTSVKNTSTMSGPATVTSIPNTEGAASTIRSRWWYRDATSADAAGGVSYVFTMGTSGTGMAAWLVLRGTATVPVEAATVFPAPSQNFTITHSSVTTLGPDRLLLITRQVADTYSFAAPTGGGVTTDLYNYTGGAGNTGSSRSQGADSEAITSAGATGDRTVVGSAVGAAIANWWVANMLSIAPLADATAPGMPTGLTVEAVQA